MQRRKAAINADTTLPPTTESMPYGASVRLFASTGLTLVLKFVLSKCKECQFLNEKVLNGEWTLSVLPLYLLNSRKSFFFFVEEAQQAQRHRNKWFKKQSSRLENKSPFTDLLSNWSGGYFFYMNSNEPTLAFSVTVQSHIDIKN